MRSVKASPTRLGTLHEHYALLELTKPSVFTSSSEAHDTRLNHCCLNSVRCTTGESANEGHTRINDCVHLFRYFVDIRKTQYVFSVRDHRRKDVELGFKKEKKKKKGEYVVRKRTS